MKRFAVTMIICTVVLVVVLFIAGTRRKGGEVSPDVTVAPTSTTEPTASQSEEASTEETPTETTMTAPTAMLSTTDEQGRLPFALFEGATLLFDPAIAFVDDEGQLAAKDGSWAIVAGEEVESSDDWQETLQLMYSGAEDESKYKIEQKEIGPYLTYVVTGTQDGELWGVYLCALGNGGVPFGVKLAFSLSSERAVYDIESMIATLTVMVRPQEETTTEATTEAPTEEATTTTQPQTTNQAGKMAFLPCEGMRLFYNPSDVGINASGQLAAKDGSWSLADVETIVDREIFDSMVSSLDEMFKDYDTTIQQKRLGKYRAYVISGVIEEIASAMVLIDFGEGKKMSGVMLGVDLFTLDALPAAEAVLATLTVA